MDEVGVVVVPSCRSQMRMTLISPVHGFGRRLSGSSISVQSRLVKRDHVIMNLATNHRCRKMHAMLFVAFANRTQHSPLCAVLGPALSTV